MFTRSSRRWAGVTVPALLLAVAGCGVWGNDSAQGTPAAAPLPSLPVPASASAGGSLGSAPPPVGEAQLSPTVQGKKVLVVGDSWAEYLGEGMAKVASDGNVIVNAGLGGCGIMMPDTVQGGKKTGEACLKWPKEWPRYMKQYKPDAVLLRTANWDMTPQSFGRSGVELTIEDVPFRQRFFKNMERAIDILSENGTPVYLTNAKIEDSWKNLSLKMNDAVQELADKYKDKGVRLLDLRAQLCNDNGCPPVLDGHKLYDATGHPAPWSRDRLAVWMLNTMFAGSPASARS